MLSLKAEKAIPQALKDRVPRRRQKKPGEQEVLQAQKVLRRSAV
jgi:hypothetical protein